MDEGCMVHGGQNRALPKDNRYDRAHPGVLWTKSGILLMPPLCKLDEINKGKGKGVLYRVVSPYLYYVVYCIV